MRLFTMLFILLSYSAVAQDVGMTEDALLEHYEEIFDLKVETVEFDGEEMKSYEARVRDSIPLEPFSRLPEDVIPYVGYLLDHTPDFLDEWMRESKEGTVNPYDLLRKDEKFKQDFYPVIGYFLKNEGVRQNFIDLRRRTVSADTVLFTAARFIYPEWGEPVKGKCTPLRVSICTGTNGWMNVKAGRDLTIEAFAYAAMISESYEELSDMYHDELFEKLNNLRRHGQAHDWIRRALWEFLVSNEHFIQGIRTRYFQMHNILPFTVEEWQ